jgi:hypothetical protein
MTKITLTCPNYDFIVLEKKCIKKVYSENRLKRSVSVCVYSYIVMMMM